MAYNRKGSKREKVFMEEESNENLKMEEHKHIHRDYITLKNRVAKAKQEGEEELLEYYTTEKFNEYFKTLNPIKSTFNAEMTN